ncbi:MAG TPA: CesT family type III secretion system chaperone [Noviherbaspirillum sp.]
MSYSKYCELIDGLCTLVGIGNPAALYSHAELTVDGEDCVLMHGGEYNEDGITVCCMFGEPPEENGDLIRQRLLEANLTAMQPGGMRYALNQSGGEVMLAGVVPLEALDPESLLALLARLAQNARQWRRHYFLGIDIEADACETDLGLSSSARTRRLS